MSDFFQQLYAVARHTPMTLLITPRGDQLNVIVTPKPTGDAEDNPGLSKPIEARGTPAELDAELAGKIREYAERVNDVRSSIKLPIEAVDAEATKGAKKSAKKKAAKVAKPKKPAAPKKAAKVVKPKPAAKKKTAQAGKIKLPGTSTAKPAAGKPRAAAAKPAASKKLGPRSALPGKPECIADYTKLFAKYGKDLTRKGFVKQAATKRRYEKLWDSWEAFIAEAAQLPLELPPAGQVDAPAVDSAPASKAAPTSRTSINPAAAWPFPGDKNSKAQAADSATVATPAPAASPVQPSAAAEPVAIKIIDRAGHEIGSTLGRLRVGEEASIQGHPHTGVIVSEVKPDRSVVVNAWPIFDLDWKPLGIWTYLEPKVGDQINTVLSDSPLLRIVEIEAGEIMASPIKPRLKGPAATAENTETN